MVAGIMLWATSASFNHALGLNLEEEEPARMPTRSIATYREDRRKKSQSLYSGPYVPAPWLGGRSDDLARQAIMEEDDSES